jgi:hypothetical protein
LQDREQAIAYRGRLFPQTANPNNKAGDCYFSRDADQNTIKRPPIIQYVSSAWPTDVMVYAIAAVVVVPPLLRKRRRAPSDDR